MRIIALSTLRAFWEAHPDAERPLRTWYQDAKAGLWHGPADVKTRYRNASFVADNRVIFNIGGNKYRLVVKVNYPHHIVYVRFVGTHRAYDEIDPETI